MKEYLIKQNDAGQRLDKFILKLAPGLPKPLLYKAIRKKDIRINGGRAEGADMLKEGDSVKVYLHSKFFRSDHLDFLAAPSQFTIVYEDDNILIARKPEGLLMHAATGDDTDNLTNRMLHHLYNCGKFDPKEELSFTPAFCNRLDRNTDGLVVAALNFPTLQLLNEKFRNGEVVRKYICQVEGIPEEKSQLLIGYHSKNSDSNTATITAHQRADTKLVKTGYKIIKSANDRSVVEVDLLTGRTHQIRAHLASIGHPLIGDTKYGSQYRGGQKLVAYYLGFNFTTESGKLDYLNGKEFSVVPKDFD